MKKSLLTAFVATSILFFTGCSSNPTPTEPAPTEENQPTTAVQEIAETEDNTSNENTLTCTEKMDTAITSFWELKGITGEIMGLADQTSSYLDSIMDGCEIPTSAQEEFDQQISQYFYNELPALLTTVFNLESDITFVDIQNADKCEENLETVIGMYWDYIDIKNQIVEFADESTYYIDQFVLDHCTLSTEEIEEHDRVINQYESEDLPALMEEIDTLNETIGKTVEVTFSLQ